MDDRIDIKTSEFALGRSPQVLVTQGIGSCVAICLYDHKQKIGSLAHVMLPRAQDVTNNPFRFVDTAIPAMLREMKRFGCKPEDIEAKIAGGAHMFKAIGGSFDDIGSKNVGAAEALLGLNGINVESEDVGGSVGRSLEFFLETGIVKVTTKM